MSDKKIAVIGAGNSGLCMTGHLLSEGYEVALWNRPDEEPFEELCRAGTISVHGALGGSFTPDLLTTSMEAAINDTPLILVAVPAHAHRAVMQQMAPLLQPGQCVVLNPGRTGGVWESRKILSDAGKGEEILLAETQTIVYTCRKTSPVDVLLIQFKQGVPLAVEQNEDREKIWDMLPSCISEKCTPAPSVLHTGFGNVGMILHTAPTLFNIGWIESPKARFRYYYEGITPSVAAFLEEMDDERLAVAKAYGVDIPRVSQWMQAAYRLPNKNKGLHAMIQANHSYAEIDAPTSLEHRYLHEDVATGLVPLNELGRLVECPTPHIDLVIGIASSILKVDFHATGRNLDRMGLSSMSADQVMYKS